MRRETAFGWLPKAWKFSAWLLWTSWLIDVVLMAWVLKNTHFSFSPQQAGAILALLFCGGYLFRSTRLRDLFADWPQETVTEKSDDNK
jgi:hypothetical protein